jgi:hypothetical protein
MSNQNNTGLSWVSDEDTYFLRDDQAMGITKYERYSLFRHWPDYGRVVIFASAIEWAIRQAHKYVKLDRETRHCEHETVFVDEQL